MSNEEEEAEVLASIFPDEFTHSPGTFSITSSNFVFTAHLPSSYPDSPPTVKINGLEEDETQEVMRMMSAWVEEGIGEQMTFTLFQNVVDFHETWERGQVEKKEREEEDEKRRIEELENRKFVGRSVTRESFDEWKKGFTHDLLTRLKRHEVGITGRMMFESDSSLANSDKVEV